MLLFVVLVVLPPRFTVVLGLATTLTAGMDVILVVTVGPDGQGFDPAPNGSQSSGSAATTGLILGGSDGAGLVNGLLGLGKGIGTVVRGLDDIPRFDRKTAGGGAKPVSTGGPGAKSVGIGGAKSSGTGGAKSSGTEGAKSSGIEGANSSGIIGAGGRSPNIRPSGNEGAGPGIIGAGPGSDGAGVEENGLLGLGKGIGTVELSDLGILRV